MKNKEYLEHAKKELEYKFSKKQLVEKYYEIAEKAERIAKGELI